MNCALNNDLMKNLMDVHNEKMRKIEIRALEDTEKKESTSKQYKPRKKLAQVVQPIDMASLSPQRESVLKEVAK